MKHFLFLLLLVSILPLEAQDLGRRVDWQAQFKSPKTNPGAQITQLAATSALKKIGLQEGDLLLQVDDQLADTPEHWEAIYSGAQAGENLNLLVRRGAIVRQYQVKLPPLPREEHPGLDTYYESITSDYGIRQRIIITRPKGVNGPQPAIFLIQGLSCTSIEVYPGRKGNWPRMIREIVEKSGMVVVRVERPGLGDSEGNCGESDFLTDLAGYRAAILALKAKDYVDTSRIVVYGSSMGSALAPLLVNEFKLAGLVSDGVFFKTWFEHMLEIERRLQEMQGKSESEILALMNEVYIPLYYGMLIEKKTYQEIIEEYPALGTYNYHSPEHMYGRPLIYYQQLQDFDLAGAWEKLKAPVRILRGSHDWIMSAYDNQMIIQVLDRSGHTDHQLYEYPGLDHWNAIHPTPRDSFEGKPGKWDPKMPALVIGWLREMAKLSN